MSKVALNSIEPAELARCLFEESNDALFLFEPMDMALLAVNPAGQRLTHLSPEDLLQRTIPELLDGDERALASLAVACQGTQSLRSKDAYWLVLDSGDRLEVNVTVSRLRLKPLPLGLLTVRDVSERQTGESQLREAQSQLQSKVEQQASDIEAATKELVETEQWMRELVDDLDVIVWEATLPDWKFTYISQHAETILGYPVAQWKSEPDFWANHIHADDRARSIESCKQSCARAEDHQFDYRMIAANGTVRWIRDIVHVVTNNQGQPKKLRGVMLDMTSKVEAEAELRERERELAHVSRLSTMGELMAGIAHEVNQPLSAIANFADASVRTLKHGRDDNEQIHSWLQQIVEQSARCADILRQLREFGRRDRSPLTAVPFNSVVENSLGLLETLVQDHQISTIVDLPADDVSVRANATELQQVIVILICNACDALIGAKTNSAAIYLQASVAGEMLRLSVSDNGPGVNAAIRDQIFDAFFTTKQEGMGMGLAICRSIVARHNGQLSLEVSNSGAQFVVMLPVA